MHPRTGVALALLVATLVAAPFPGTAQTGGAIPVDANSTDQARVDLRTDAGKVIHFTLSEADFTAAQGASSMAAHLALPDTTETLFIAAVRDSSGVWTAQLPVDTVDLVKGTWKVTYYAIKPNGGVILKQRDLTVSLADADAPRIELKPAGDPVRLGPGDVLEIDIDEEFLRSVTLQHAGLPQPLELLAPYQVSVDSLPEGPLDVTVVATDRAGQVSSAVARVDRDTLAPQLSVSVPEVGYVGVPFAIIANATERSQNTVRLVHNGSAESRTVGGAASDVTTSHVFVATLSEVGEPAYTVEAIDASGNRASSVFTIPIVAPPTDTRAVSIGMAPGPAPFVGHPAIIVATLEQVSGVTSLPVTVTFSTAGKQEAMTVTLPAAGATTVEWNVTLPPGPREVRVSVAAPDFANETNPGNENATATVETFLGSVRLGGDLFLVRADERGLPKAAVEQGTSRSYPLTLNQTGRGVVYTFELAGGQTGVWDPLSPIAPDPGEVESSSSTSTGSKGAAAPGLLMALLVVALAALAQRRLR